MGPISPTEHQGGKYLLVLVDEATRFVVVYTMHSKSETPARLLEFYLAVVKRQRLEWSCLKSDRGGEFSSTQLAEWCKSVGVVQDYSPAYDPQSNGSVERVNRTLTEMARAMVHHSGVPTTFWGDAFGLSAYVHNRLPNQLKGVSSTPYQRLTGRVADVTRLRTFGCAAYYYDHHRTRYPLPPLHLPLYLI